MSQPFGPAAFNFKYNKQFSQQYYGNSGAATFVSNVAAGAATFVSNVAAGVYMDPQGLL